MDRKSQEAILKGHLWALEKMGPTLQTLFLAATEAIKELDEPPHVQSQENRNLLTAMERGATLQRAQEIYASSIFLVFDQWLKGLRKSLGLPGEKTEHGEQIGDARLGPLIWATANNFRHTASGQPQASEP